MGMDRITMTEKDYLKMITEFTRLASEAIGFLSGVPSNDNI